MQYLVLLILQTAYRLFGKSMVTETNASAVVSDSAQQRTVCYHSGSHWSDLGSTNTVFWSPGVYGQDYGSKYKSG